MTTQTNETTNETQPVPTDHVERVLADIGGIDHHHQSTPGHPTKPYRVPQHPDTDFMTGELLVDANLSVAVLDRLNVLPGLWVIETCEGCADAADAWVTGAYVVFLVDRWLSSQTKHARSLRLLEEFDREMDATPLGRSSSPLSIRLDSDDDWFVTFERRKESVLDRDAWWEALVGWLEDQTANLSKEPVELDGADGRTDR